MFVFYIVSLGPLFFSSYVPLLFFIFFLSFYLLLAVSLITFMQQRARLPVLLQLRCDLSAVLINQIKV